VRECCKGDDASQWENGKFVTDKDQVFASAVWYQEWHPAHKTSQQNFLLRTSTCDCQVTGLYLGCRAADCIPGQVVYTRASVTKQYNLVVANGRWCSAAWEVTASLAESNGSLLTALVTCGLTAEDRNQLRNITLISSMEPRLGEWRGCPADQGLPQNWPFKLCVCMCGRHLLHYCVQAVIDSGVRLSSILADNYARSYCNDSLSRTTADRLITLGFSLGNVCLVLV